MQDQLKDAGITIEMVSYDEPEGTYMSTGDFDLAVYYCSSSAGTDPYAFPQCRIILNRKHELRKIF